MKPCPFCAGEKCLSVEIQELPTNFENIRAFVTCSRCHTAGPSVFRKKEIPNISDQAIEGWDIRTTEDELHNRIGALEKILKEVVDVVDAQRLPIANLCLMSAIHGAPYDGPKWKDEIERAKSILSAPNTPKEKQT